MRWPRFMVGLLLLALIGRALAEETPVYEGEPEKPAALQAYDRIIVRFNTNVKVFPSWEAFKAEVFSRIPAGTPGKCYELIRGGTTSVDVTKVRFQKAADNDWQETSGKGWRRFNKDHTFIEYRVNETAGVLMRAEGVKPWFFFAQIKKICEFPYRP